jgi:hypothetical protein
MIDYSFKLNNVTDEKYQPKELEALEIIAQYVNNSVQPDLTATEITLINEGAVAVNNYIDGSLNGTTRGIFEGLPYEILLLSENPPYNAFKGYLDLLTIKRQCDQVKVKLVSAAGLNKFSERCQATTFGYLYDQGLITQTDFTSVPYVINYIPDGVQLIMTSISLFLIAKETYETVPKIPEYIADLILAAIPTVGVGATIDVGNIIICAVKLILLIVYTVLLILAIIDLIEALLSEIYSIKRWHKGCKIGTLLEKACESLGYNFSSTIFTGNYFQNLVFIPYKTAKGKLGKNDVDEGVPNSSAYGYTVYEIFQLAMDMFNAKILIKGDTVYLESLQNTAFWNLNSSYVLPDIEVLEKKYNTDELNPNYVVKFQYDTQDMNTIDNFLGTNYERITKPVSINEKANLNFGGLTEITMQVALATRKDETSTLEDILSGLATVVDAIIGLFGGNSDFVNGFLDRIGSMSLSNHFGWLPKVVVIESDKVSIWNKAYLSAKHLYENYHSINSFVANDFGGQYEVYEDIIIPFCLHDFLQTIESSYFTTSTGLLGKFDKITWNFTQMYAKVTCRIQKPYTKNLTEIFIEPE